MDCLLVGIDERTYIFPIVSDEEKTNYTSFIMRGGLHLQR
jgi:hypothetical protein